MEKNQRIVFHGPVPAGRMWLLVNLYAKARGLRMMTDRHQQNAFKLYIETARLYN